LIAVVALLLPAVLRSAVAQDVAPPSVPGFGPAPRSLYNASPDQALFACGPATSGQVACQAGSKCKCLHEPFGNAMLGLPPGYRWDCDPMYGSCLVDIPAETSSHLGGPKREGGSPVPFPYPVPTPPTPPDRRKDDRWNEPPPRPSYPSPAPPGAWR